MNTKIFKTALGLSLAALLSGASALANEAISSKDLFECTERHPQASGIPMELRLTQEINGSHFLTVGRNLKDSAALEMVYAASMVRNRSIRCMVPCEHFDNKDEQTTLIVTHYPSFIHAFVRGALSDVEFGCTKNAP